MNYRMYILLLLLLLLVNTAFTQAVTLEMCRNAAHDNYPSIKQYGLIEKSRGLDVSNASKAWIPGVRVSGVAVGFTDLLDKDKTGGMIDLSNGIYAGALTISQTVYDGGLIKARKDIIKAEADVRERKLDIDFNDLDARIEEIYFGILMLDENLRQIGLLQDNLDIAGRTVKSLMDGGLASQADLDVVNVNRIESQKEQIRLKNMRKTYVMMLSYFCPTVTELQNDTTVLEIPGSISSKESSDSYTLSMFEARESVLDAQKKELNSRIIPKINAFAMGALHNNIMPQMHNANLFVGGMIQWNIGAFYTRRNDLLKLENSRNLINTERETFLFEKRLQQQSADNRIESIRQMMELDDKTISFRESIMDKSRTKVVNGTETINEMLRNINELCSARLQKSIHEIELLKELYKLDNLNLK